jgi:hypothetical protein
MLRLCALLLAAGAGLWAQWTVAPFQPDSTQLASADLREIFELLCPGQERACRVCPAATKLAGAGTDGSVESMIRGHFLKPDSDDLLVTLYGCGAALLTHSSSGWFANRVDNLPDGLCRKLPGKNGRDGLVCFAASSSADHQRARLTFGFVPEPKIDVATAIDNTAGACDAPRRIVVQSAIREVRFTKIPNGKWSVRVLANCRRGPLSPRSAKACRQGAGFADIGPSTPFRKFEIDYSFDGEALSLAPASRLMKRAYDACTAEGK